MNVARMSAGEAVVRTLWFLSWSLVAKTAAPGSANDTNDTASGKLSSGKTRLNCSTNAFLGWKWYVFHFNIHLDIQAICFKIIFKRSHSIISILMEYEFNIEKNKVNKLTIAYTKIIMKFTYIQIGLNYYTKWLKRELS